MQKGLGFASVILSLSLIAGCTANLAGNINTGKQPGANANVGASIKFPDPITVGSTSALGAFSCSQESEKISGAGTQAAKMTFTNKTQAKIKIYWLDQSGKRREYHSPGLDAGASYTQDTYLGHYWLIANEQDECQGIYVPSMPSGASIEVTSTVRTGAASSGSTSGAVSGSGNLTLSGASEERIRQGIACLNAKGKTSLATSVQGLLNLYLNFKNVIGVDAAAKGYLTGAVETLNKEGC